MQYSHPDAKNCTFMPKTNESKKKKQSESNNDSDDEEAKESRGQNFLLRQEASEKKRINEQTFQTGKQKYDALVDKKRCPVCTATQSYDEVKEKRKRCPNCQVPYTFKTNWGQVQNSFYKRQNDAYVNGIRALDEMKREVIESERRSMKTKVDNETGEVYTVQGGGTGDEELQWTRDVEDDFFTRMAESKVRREAKLKCLEEELYGGAGRGSKSKNKRSGGDPLYSADNEFDTSQYY